MDVYLPRDDEPSFADLLRDRVASGIQLRFGTDLPEPANYDVLVSGRPSEESLGASARLKTVVIPFAGIPPETRDRLLTRPELAVYNLHHNATATAEMALALLLAVGKTLLPADRDLRVGDWTRRYGDQDTLLMESRTAVVVGYGQIGRRFARMVEGLGMKVIGISRGGGGGARPIGDLDNLLPQADVLVLCVPGTPETRGMIGARELALLPSHAVLINVARGAVVAESALYEALVNRSLAGAGLDVWWQYPQDEASRVGTSPSELPFHELENVVMSPHRAGHTEENEERRADELAHVLRCLARGETPPHRVDVEAGY